MKQRLLHPNIRNMKTTIKAKTAVAQVGPALLFLLFMQTTFCMAQVTGRPQTDDEFLLARADEHVAIYYRWMEAGDNRMARQLKAVFTVESTPEAVLSVIRDDRSFTGWMSGTKTYYRVKSVDVNQWYSYVQFEVPWPLNNQDCILRYTLQEKKEEQSFHVEIQGTPAYMKEFEGVKRISHLQIRWILTRTAQNQTRVEYYVFSNQVSKVPKKITDPIIQGNLLRTMNAFRNTVLERRVS